MHSLLHKTILRPWGSKLGNWQLHGNLAMPDRTVASFSEGWQQGHI